VFINITQLFYRVLIKLWSLVCILVTKIRHPIASSNSNLLLLYYTNVQSEWENSFTYIKTNQDFLNYSLLVVIPFRDKWNYTYRCLTSLNLQDFNGMNVTVVLADNGSIEDKTHQGIEELKSRNDLKYQISYVRYDIPFNFSTLNNMAVNDHLFNKSDYLLLLNNDVEFLESDSLVSMVTFISNNPDCGALGCTLLYPDRKIQHIFISVGAKIVGAHPFRGKIYNPSEEWFSKPRVVAATTGAVLLTSLKDYKNVNGLDEKLGTSYQDVDYCLKIQDLGKYIAVYSGTAMIHHETVTRAPEPNWREVYYIYNKWHNKLTNNKYFSSMFTRWSAHLAFSLGEGDFPWKKLVVPKNPKQIG